METKRLEVALFCVPVAIAYDPLKTFGRDILKGLEWDVRFSQIVENAIELGLSDQVELVRVSSTLLPANEIGGLQQEILETLCPEAVSAEDVN